MKKVKIYQVDAFTKFPFGGNPAGVVTDAQGLTEEEMQKIAREMNCSETAFVRSSLRSDADFEVRFFTPTEEVDLCGHATIATFHVLAKEGRIPLWGEETVVRQDTKAGILDVTFVCDKEGSLKRIVMDQKLPEIRAFKGAAADVAELMGLEPSNLELQGLPIQIVSTGLPDLIVPVSDLAALKKAAPDFEKLARYQIENGFISIHAFTFETEHSGSDIHTRDFAPSVGINEESATGTANGALAAYLYINKSACSAGGGPLTIEQGYTMGRPSEIIAQVITENGSVSGIKVGGSAVIMVEGTMTF